jgi:hypothetical protein
MAARQVSKVTSQTISYRALALVVRAALLVALAGAGWLVYKKLPGGGAAAPTNAGSHTTIQIVLQRSPDLANAALDIPVEISPVDLVAVKHEFFVEPRAGQRFDEFLRERENGRAAVLTRLDSQGRASVLVAPGDWWLHAVLPGDESFEWRLKLTVGRETQTVELTQQNVYTRSKSF